LQLGQEKQTGARRGRCWDSFAPPSKEKAWDGKGMQQRHTRRAESTVDLRPAMVREQVVQGYMPQCTRCYYSEQN